MPKVLRGTARRELIEVLRPRYRDGGKSEKRAILKELIAVTGYHRKSAIRALNRRERDDTGVSRPSRRVYDETFKRTLVVLWNFAQRPCGKRLHDLMPRLIAQYERQNHVIMASTPAQKLNKASAATIDRLLRESRKVSRATRLKTTSDSAGVSTSVEAFSLPVVPAHTADISSDVNANISMTGHPSGNGASEDNE